MIRLTSMEDMEDIVDGTSGTDENGCSLPPDIASDMKWLRVVLYDQKSIDAISRIESTILALTEQVGVRDAAMRWLAVELSNSIDLNEHYAAKMEDLNTPRPATMWSKKPMGGSAPMSPHGKKRIEELIKAALDAAKEGKNDGSN